MTPREVLVQALQPLLPGGWTVIDSERASDARGTTLRLQQHAVRRLPVAGTGVHEIEFTATLTVAGDDLQRAEDRLDDELTAFVQTLDTEHVLWTEWTKALYDGALGYQATILITAERDQ